MSISYKRAKIVATIGPSTDSYEKIEEMVRSGVNGFRLNFSHGTHEERDRQIPWIRKAAEAAGKPVAVVQDLQGPKIRLGVLQDDRMEVKKGDELVLAYGVEHDGGNTVPTQYDLSEKVKVDEHVYIFDGKVKTKVVEVMDRAIRVHVQNNGVIMSRKGLNLPDTDFGGDIFTQKDLADIDYGVGQDIDYVAFSFVQSVDDVNHLRKMLTEKGSDAKIIAKIETRAAIKPDALEAIVMASDGVMVARGDLAVEAGAEVVPVVQRRILSLCQKYGKISIVATQMLASMVEHPEPTRAEVSDVASAIILGTDCVMLSDETANGSYPIEAIQTMKRVILHIQEELFFQADRSNVELTTVDESIRVAAVELAQNIRADAIVIETASGANAFSFAALRPSLPIMTVTSSRRVAQQLTLLYANKAFLRPEGYGGLDLAKELREKDLLAKDSTVVIVGADQKPGLLGSSDTIRVRVLE